MPPRSPAFLPSTCSPADATPPEGATGGRAFCYACHKVQAFCVCALAQPVDNRCAITILQHPRERHHPIGTARLARLGLRHAEVVVCWGTQAPPALQAAADATWGVLYPAEHARNLAEVCRLPQAAGPQLPRRLVVLDGTWSHAKALYRANPWLARLPHFRIDPAGPDRYRIRREPQAHYTSTLEAIITALSHLEPQTRGLADLMQAFDVMIDRQVDCIQACHDGARRRRRPRSRPQTRGIPQALVAHPERTVVLFAEFMQQQHGARRHRTLVYWTALHLTTGAFFGACVRPQGEGPSRAHLAHMQLDAALLQQSGVDLATLRARFAAFCGPAVHFLAWNQATLALLRQDLNDRAPAWLLKAIFCTVNRLPGCTLAQALLQAGVRATPTAAHGRANGRLGASAALAHAVLAKAMPVAAASAEPEAMP